MKVLRETVAPMMHAESLTARGLDGKGRARCEDLSGVRVVDELHLVAITRTKSNVRTVQKTTDQSRNATKTRVMQDENIAAPERVGC